MKSQSQEITYSTAESRAENSADNHIRRPLYRSPFFLLGFAAGFLVTFPFFVRLFN